MTPERFEALAEAYGGDVARWPHGEREAAAALMAADAAWATDLLSRAGALDDLMAADRPMHASPNLVERIVAGAPRPRARWIGWLLPAGMGAGLAAACAAGVMVGAQLHAPPSSTPGASDVDALVAAIGDDDVSLYLDEDA